MTDFLFSCFTGWGLKGALKQMVLASWDVITQELHYRCKISNPPQINEKMLKRAFTWRDATFLKVILKGSFIFKIKCSLRLKHFQENYTVWFLRTSLHHSSVMHWLALTQQQAVAVIHQCVMATFVNSAPVSRSPLSSPLTVSSSPLLMSFCLHSAPVSMLSVSFVSWLSLNQVTPPVQKPLHKGIKSRTYGPMATETAAEQNSGWQIKWKKSKERQINSQHLVISSLTLCVFMTKHSP